MHLTTSNIDHGSTTVIRCCTSIGHSTHEVSLILHHGHVLHVVHVINLEAHRHIHTLIIHGLQRINLLINHVVYAYLGLPSWLLWGHRKVVWLVHGVLILRLLLVWVLYFLIWILSNFMHLDLVSNRWWWLRILDLVNCITSLLMDVVLASSWSCAAGIWIDRSNPLILRRLTRCTKIILVWFYLLYGIFHLRNVNSATIMASLAVSTDFVVWYYPSWRVLLS